MMKKRGLAARLLAAASEAEGRACQMPRVPATYSPRVLNPRLSVTAARIQLAMPCPMQSARLCPSAVTATAATAEEMAARSIMRTAEVSRMSA